MKQTAVYCVMLFMLLTGVHALVSQMQIQYYEEGEAMAVETAVRHSLELLSDRKDTQRNMTESELYAEFLNNLMLEMGNCCTYKINVYEADTQKGILDISVTIGFENFYGSTTEVSVRKKGLLTEY